MSRPINPWKATGYKAGQNVICRVVKAEADGFAVTIPKDNLPGFIRTNAHHSPGEEVLAQFVCVHNGRILLSPLFGQNRVAGSMLPAKTQTNWMEQVDNPDQAATAETSNNQNYAPPGYGQQNQEQPAQNPYQAHERSPFQMPDNAAQEPQPYSQETYEAPQQQWQSPIEEQTPTKRFRLRRAIDLVMPPIDIESQTLLNMADYDLGWLITDLEGGMRTGCMKSTSEQQLSRSAVLLYRGKAVGCIYGSKSAPEQRPTEESLYCMLNDLQAADAMVSIYDLPEAVTGAMSALFLGFPEPREDGLNELDQFNAYMTNFTQNGNTACLAISVPSTSSLCLVFVHKGIFGGAFFVEDQIYTKDPEDIFKLFRGDPDTRVDASKVPQEFVASGSRFGYSLSMAKQKR